MLENKYQTTPAPVKRNGVKRFFGWLFLLVIIIFSIFCYWKYSYTYSDGYRNGLMQKLSHRGNMIKTYEGELVMSSVTSTNNVALASEKFYFSVPNDSIAKVLQSFEGKQVKLHYVQKNGTLFWRGDSEYLVDGVSSDTIIK